MTLTCLISFIPPLLSGLLLMLLFFPPADRAAAGLLFRLFAGGGLGIGVTSCLYFIALLTGLADYYPAFDLGLCLLLGAILFFQAKKKGLRREGSFPESRTSLEAGKSGGKGARTDPAVSLPGSPVQQILTAVLFAAALLCSLISFIIAYWKEPHGRWDAWLIWNMHARFLFRGGDLWREAFASGLDWSHWDYPLLLPLSIARGWTYGGESVWLPAGLAFVFTFLTLGLLGSSLALLRDGIRGCLGGMLLMGTPLFIIMGASQFADMPLALFILTTLVLLFIAMKDQGRSGSRDHHPGIVVLAGLAAGLCAWTKNEGLLFLMIAAGCFFCATAWAQGWKSALSRIAWFFAGALPVLAILLYFKMSLAPVNDLVAGFSGAAVGERLTDLSRYSRILKAFFIVGVSFTQGLIDIRQGMRIVWGPVNVLLLVAYLWIAGLSIERRHKDGLALIGAVLLLMAAGYFLVYVLTPLDLDYHLMTSLNRLFLQLWPALIFAVLMAAGPAGTESSLPERTQGRRKPTPRTGSMIPPNTEAT